MTELEPALISECVPTGMKAAKAKGKTVGRPKTPRRIVVRIEKLAFTAEMIIRQIHQ